MFLKSLVAPSAASAPGIALAAEMESTSDQNGWRAPETLVRRRREWAVARDEQQFREAQERRCAEEAAEAARAQIPLGPVSRKAGQDHGAIAFYQKIVRDASGTEEGRLAAAKVSRHSAREKKIASESRLSSIESEPIGLGVRTTISSRNDLPGPDQYNGSCAWPLPAARMMALLTPLLARPVDLVCAPDCISAD